MNLALIRDFYKKNILWAMILKGFWEYMNLFRQKLTFGCSYIQIKSPKTFPLRNHGD